ncbi:large conductance mechanosensitive channel protein MscL [Corallococcus llansteffanensis]|uniref:Large-conductance mechanosensitive channel n=1 Tax=Corallococcus llansteffanensis TaxID=2316731 RepID=A0A3A8R161_9BACT|nr:large conductance mechanosensitive channel protein MscL [Corallococcus llansteffanensis]RKH69024.1 large conductance mechanosensitive channel protein MscL [Corallococcus llansteffanensis]
MSVLSEFKQFALKGNVVDLAVAVVIGNAFTAIVNAVVSDLVMPVVGLVLPGGDWREVTVTPLQLRVGHLLGAMLDFLIIALVLFLVVVKMSKLWSRKEAPPPPSTRVCPECREAIPLEARRCRACTSVLEPLASTSA